MSTLSNRDWRFRKVHYYLFHGLCTFNRYYRQSIQDNAYKMMDPLQIYITLHYKQETHKEDNNKKHSHSLQYIKIHMKKLTCTVCCKTCLGWGGDGGWCGCARHGWLQYISYHTYVSSLMLRPEQFYHNKLVWPWYAISIILVLLWSST
jgi:hypothetical protein